MEVKMEVRCYYCKGTSLPEDLNYSIDSIKVVE